VLSLLAVALTAAAPSLASALTTWCNGCYDGVGHVIVDSSYINPITGVLSYDYYATGAGSCAGDWWTSTNSWYGYTCQRPTSGYNYAYWIPGSSANGHPAFSNFQNGGAWYFTSQYW